MQLVDRALAILDEHGPRLFAMLVRLTLRADVAEELMQELFCKLAQDKRCASARDPAAYAVRMGMNLAFDYRRAQRRMRTAETAAAPSAEAMPSPLGQLVQREELRRMLDAIDQLPVESREVIVLRYLERQDYTTIADQLDKSPHHVRAVCHRALSRLRDLLGAQRPSKVGAVLETKREH
ncbi:MAG: sigma-70 family RNA polymerase sigma factor [Pirellulales bacterium]|nr:sigma-70 family RNA polymerase sigma factor [Pirellulales bacterium]